MRKERREMDTEELRKKYGKRYVFEWFMRAEDQRYWRMAKNMIKEESRKTTAIIGINAVVTVIIITFLVRYTRKN